MMITEFYLTTEQSFKEKSAHAFTFTYKAKLDQLKMGISPAVRFRASSFMPDECRALPS